MDHDLYKPILSALMAEVPNLTAASYPLFSKPDWQPRDEKEVEAGDKSPEGDISLPGRFSGGTGSLSYCYYDDPTPKSLLVWENGRILSGQLQSEVDAGGADPLVYQIIINQTLCTEVPGP